MKNLTYEKEPISKEITKKHITGKSYVHHLKDLNNEYYGTVLMFAKEKKLFIGFSMCHRELGDVFGRKRGGGIARGRAIKYNDVPKIHIKMRGENSDPSGKHQLDIPVSMVDPLKRMWNNAVPEVQFKLTLPEWFKTFLEMVDGQIPVT